VRSSAYHFVMGVARRFAGWVASVSVFSGLACDAEDQPATSGGSAGATAAAGVGGASGAATGGNTGAGVGGAAGAGAPGGKGGKAGANAGGSAGAGSGDWAEACDGVTMLGHCVGEVYEWCDYFARGLKRIDCGARGMTCRAEPRVPGSDFVNAGCFGDPCTEDEETCDGTMAEQCTPSGMVLFDCTKTRGLDATCGVGENGAGCVVPPCSPDRVIRCDGNVAVLCALDNVFYIQNCAEQDPAGTCEPQQDGALLCGSGLIYP
jgi:hypothetical protein